MEKVKALKLSEIAENTSKILEINDKKIAVFNVDGEFYAIDDTCSHAEASLSEGEVFDCIVECPLHGAEFNLTPGLGYQFYAQNAGEIVWTTEYSRPINTLTGAAAEGAKL